MEMNKLIENILENDEIILKYLSISMIIFSVIAFILEMSGIYVPYGRYANTKGKGWGIQIPARIAWIIMESPTLIIMSLFYFKYGSEICLTSLSNKLLMSLFIIHYINRAVIYPFRMSQGTPMPIIVLLIAWFYVIWNSFTQALALTRVFRYQEEWIYDPRFIIGVILFFFGFISNIQADNILLGLKAQKDKNNASNIQSKTSGYQIPYGGLFEYVSCANYASEIIEWTGFAIACWSISASGFAIMTFCNLGPRASHHHKWYQQKFENYPKNRKAIIPFIW